MLYYFYHEPSGSFYIDRRHSRNVQFHIIEIGEVRDRSLRELVSYLIAIGWNAEALSFITPESVSSITL